MFGIVHSLKGEFSMFLVFCVLMKIVRKGQNGKPKLSAFFPSG